MPGDLSLKSCAYPCRASTDRLAFGKCGVDKGHFISFVKAVDCGATLGLAENLHFLGHECAGAPPVNETFSILHENRKTRNCDRGFIIITVESRTNRHSRAHPQIALHEFDCDIELAAVVYFPEIV